MKRESRTGVQKDDKWIRSVAYHEAGHAVMSMFAFNHLIATLKVEGLPLEFKAIVSDEAEIKGGLSDDDLLDMFIGQGLKSYGMTFLAGPVSIVRSEGETETYGYSEHHHKNVVDVESLQPASRELVNAHTDFVTWNQMVLMSGLIAEHMCSGASLHPDIFLKHPDVVAARSFACKCLGPKSELLDDKHLTALRGMVTYIFTIGWPFVDAAANVLLKEKAISEEDLPKLLEYVANYLEDTKGRPSQHRGSPSRRVRKRLRLRK
ncbi:MAG: hypothetical protein L6Q71_06550 [Planctomycetes bacterium]|nr:hypothetical protein [Planctomycetota bacterium]